MTIVDTRYGPMRIIDSDSIVSKSLKIYGEWAESEIDLLKNLVSPGDCVVDVGAFIGTHTVALAKAAGTNGKVYSFEPRREIFQVLSSNIELNRLDNIVSFNFGLGDSATTIAIGILNLELGDNFGGLALNSQENDEAGPTYNVSVITLDSLNLVDVKFIKLDVEGMEGQVIRGARETILRSRPFIFTECNSIAGGTDILRICEELGYSVFGCLGAAYNPQNFNQVAENIFEEAMELGLLLLPRENSTAIVSRIKTHKLPKINDQDDLALLLLHKPQYIADILSGSSVGKLLGINFSTPASREANNLLSDCKISLAAVEELARTRLEEIERLGNRITATDIGLEAAQRMALDRLQEIQDLSKRVMATDLALEEVTRLAVSRLNEIEHLSESRDAMNAVDEGVQSDTSKIPGVDPGENRTGVHKEHQ